MNRHILILSLLFCLFSNSNLYSQFSNCIAFSEPQVGTTFSFETGANPGLVVHEYEEQDVNMIMDTYSNEGVEEFGSLVIQEFVNSNLGPGILNINSATARFVYSTAQSGVCFQMVVNDDPINLGINGQIAYLDNILSDQVHESFPNHNINASQDGDWIYVCISGIIEGFSLGATDILVDNICAEPIISNCFNNEFYIQTVCENAEAVSLFIDFEPVGVNNSFFDLFINDEFYGFYAFADLPLLLPNVVPSGLYDSIELRIQENDNPSCAYTEVVPLPVCFTEGCIGFEIYSDEMENAFNNGWPLNTLYYQEQGVTFTTTYVTLQDVVFVPDGMARFAPNTIEGFTTSNFISIGHWDMGSIIDFTGHDETVNEATLDFYFLGGFSNVINVGINGQAAIEYSSPFEPGSVTYSFPDGSLITVTHNEADPNLGTMHFESENLSEILVGGGGFVMDNLCFGPSYCAISNLNVGQYACDGNEDIATFYLNLTPNSLATDSFVLQINSIVYDTFLYDNLPITNINIESIPGQAVHFLVYDLLVEGCAEDLTIEVNNCEFACADFAAEVTSFECDGTSSGLVNIFVTTPPTNAEFSLFGYADEITRYTIYENDSPNQISFVFEEVPPIQDYLLTDLLTGCTTVINPFNEFINCNPCEILDLALTPTDCNDGFYYINVDFETTHPDEQFYITLNGDEVFGPFFSNNIPPIGPVYGGNLETYVVEIYSESEECYAVDDVTYQCESQCFRTEVELGDCQNDGSADLTIYLVEFGASDAPLTIIIDGENFGTYDYGAFPLTLEGAIAMSADPIVSHTIEILQEGSGCAYTHNVLNPCTGFCEIYDLTLSPTDCIDGYYYVNVDFETNYPNDLFFITLEGDQVFGPFPINDIPPIGPIDGINIHSSTVEIYNQSEQCYAIEDITYGCESPCFRIEADLGECYEDGSADLIVHLVEFGNSDAPLTIIIDGENFGTYGYGDFPLTLPQAISAGPISVHTITVSQEASDCIYVQDVINNCPGGGCEIYDISITGSECDANNQYFLSVTFESNTPGPFEVINEATGESHLVSLNDLPVQFGPMDFNEIQTSLIFIVTANPFCAAEEIYVHECEPIDDCNFSNIFAEAYACDGDQFLVDVEFDNPNGGPLGFYIFGDGMIFGPYQYGETYYTFGPLNGTTSDHTIMLLDIADPSCFGNYNFGYTCTEECQIISVIAEPTDCNEDGLFYVALDVEAVYQGDSFTVVGNGNNYGEYSYNDLPITLGPFEGDGVIEYEFGVIDLQNANCTNWTSFVSPNCQPCDIRDFTYEIDCGEDFYTLTIDFIYENPEADQFALIIGDEVYEWFQYSSLPLTLDFISFGINGETIRVEDIENELCGQTLPFDIPCCNLGNILNELSVTDCEDNGEYFLSVGQFNGGNLSDSLVIDYAPAGSSIIATVVVAYADLAEEIGPLVGDGSTGYLFVFSDQENECTQTTTLDPIFCDDASCVEFEGTQGVFGPGFNHDSGDLVLEENNVRVTYERNPVTECACNLFILDGLANIDFGTDHVIVTDDSGFGLNFSNVNNNFNTVNIDFYHPGGDVSVSVNGQAPITASSFDDLPTNIGTGVELQVVNDPNSPENGLLTFNGDIESIQIFSNATAAFDNVCISLDDNIWPGDTNSDNVANNFDLLNIGIAYGSTGPSRTEVNEEWAGFIAQNWGDNFADDTNFKHADANGDGVVNEEDQVVLEQNYGLEHGPQTDFEPLPFTDLDPIVYLEVLGGQEFPNGAAFEIPIIAGTADQPINDIYGLAFTLVIDPNVIDLSSVEIVYPTSWFGEPSVNTIHLHHINDDGNIEVAISRKDLNPVSGFGPIMHLRGIIDDIALLTPATTIDIDKIHAIDYDENPIVLRPGGADLVISSINPTIDRDMLKSSFSLYPNPATDKVYFTNYYNMPADRISVYNSSGQLVFTVNDPDMEMSVDQLPVGVYHLKIHLQGFIFTERLVKIE